MFSTDNSFATASDFLYHCVYLASWVLSNIFKIWNSCLQMPSALKSLNLTLVSFLPRWMNSFQYILQPIWFKGFIINTRKLKKTTRLQGSILVKRDIQYSRIFLCSCQSSVDVVKCCRVFRLIIMIQYYSLG